VDQEIPVTVDLSDYCKYKGKLHGGVPTGKGELTCDDGAKYIGDFV